MAASTRGKRGGGHEDTHTMSRHGDSVYAINKTRGIAFARKGEAEDWEPVDFKTIQAMDEMERVSHTKIGENWFSIYKSGHAGASER